MSRWEGDLDDAQKIKETVFCVEADGFAQHALWGDNERARAKGESWSVEWEEVNPGWLITVGEVEIDGKTWPVCISITFAFLNGQRVLFWYATSKIVHHDMIEDWFDKNCAPRWDNGTRRARCDATNFGHCLSHVLELSRVSA